MNRKTFLNTLVILALMLATFILALPPRTAAHPATQALTLPATMPVFHILPTQVDAAVILGNSAMLSGIGATNVFSDTSQGGLDHFSAFNPDTGNIVEQYDRTGGLFAVNYTRAYSETEMSYFPTNADVCNFLMVREMFPWSEVEPQYTDCGSNPAYTVKQIHLSTVDPSTGNGTNSVIGELIQVPLAVNIGDLAPYYIPMGGPGGHLSLLLSGSPNTPPLDDVLPGLQGMANPWYGRTLDFEPIGYYPVVPMSEAVARFQAQFPAKMQVNAGTPEMIYYVGFPDTPQDALMPTWTFPNATAVLSGTVINLKETTLPGVDGFAPAVNILSPTDGTAVSNGEHVWLTFAITGDQGPFTYTISADDTPLATGVTLSGMQMVDLGQVSFDGRLDGHSLSVHAVNSYHIAGDDTAFLSPNQLYLPLTVRPEGLLNSTPSLSASSPISSKLSNNPDATLRIGVEWVMNYHNPDSNLYQTQPDAEGLYNWLGVNGWARTFNYGNDAAWEKDWRDCSLGGIDCGIGVDRVDFAYFSGHGSPTAWYFGGARDYGGAWGGNSRFQTIRWAAFSSCNTVRAGPYVGPGNPPLTEWFNSFQGSYMILGFHSVMGDVPFGFNFGFNMRNPLYDIWPWMQPSIAQAWVNTAFSMNAGKPAYLYAVGNFDPSGYKLPYSNAGPLPPLTGIYQFRWVWWDE